MTEKAPYSAEPAESVVDGRYRLYVNRFFRCDWCSVFNTAQFFSLHKTARAFYFQLCLGSPPQVAGVAHFTEMEAGHYRSPRRGTFGGYEFHRSLRIETIEGFVDEVEQVLKTNGARMIEILEPPALFDPCKADVLCNVLYRRGYQRRAPELDYLMTVDAGPLWEKLKPSRRQRINRCKREGMVARHVEPELCQEVYDVIVQNRMVKGYPITMTGEEVQQMLAAFPDRLFFFGAFRNDMMIASSICVKVNDAILYVFYWGDLPGYEKFSPVSLLAECIYDYAKANRFTLIDFGTSTKDGVPIYGLINFKREIGCFPCLKPGYVKLID